ncbi:hypothetical protein M413DRAFT_155249 [Hebeloma cylindrosporum]|uniref:Uncharacterized protein n=1 Tax=Hebeloma cylindrosporum TaxID=76867 RepID=A0A0C3BW89_HEBCY|nr:hypothetical protein M413DRAFT_155249 [Hebeloma cylindrosporum h7]
MSYNKDNATTGLPGTAGIHSDYGRSNPQYGRDTLGNTGPGNVSSSGMRDTETYGGMGTATTGASSFPESPTMNPTAGRGTTTGAYESSRYGTGTTTGASTGVVDPGLHTTTRTGVMAGAGIHAQQYSRYGEGYKVGSTTTVSSGATPGVGHHVAHHHHHEHGHAAGEGLKAGCATCRDTSTGPLKVRCSYSHFVDIS